MDDQQARAHGQKKIIFFDALGFGWVLDKAALKEINLHPHREEIIIDQVLADIIQSSKGY